MSFFTKSLRKFDFAHSFKNSLIKFNTTRFKSLFIYIFSVYSQKDYVCFDFVPRHHNIIRYRKGIAVIKDNFHTVCSWVQFQNKETWKYDLFLCEYFYNFTSIS